MAVEGNPAKVETHNSLDHIWVWQQRLPERKGQKCRVPIRTKAGHNCLVEFSDGFMVITSQWAVRKEKGSKLFRAGPWPAFG
jgi:hypothetical protein